MERMSSTAARMASRTVSMVMMTTVPGLWVPGMAWNAWAAGHDRAPKGGRKEIYILFYYFLFCDTGI
jgi:hypothetical protein